MLRRSILFISLLAGISCSRTAGSPEPVTQPLPRDIPETPRITQGTWSFTQDPRPTSYKTTSTTILELQLDTVTQHDTIKLTTSYTVTATGQADSTRFTGSIDDISLETGRRIGQSLDSTRLPLSFIGRIDKGLLVLDSAGKTTLETSRVCIGSSPSVFPVIQRNLV